ncbi:ABC transporter substrate-binding protein [Pseudohalioglobus sediminis]|nr:ABC transporter substrate-binding protein [Pseudohalioglobus sediminis]
MTTSTRRNLLKSAGAIAGGASLLGTSLGATSEVRRQLPQVKVAGYDYDRVKGIMDGRAGIEGAEVSFHYEDIYSVNELAFGDDKPYEVSELGLIPYVNKFINKDYRGYTLIPVFISRVFRHRNIFVRADSGIEKPEDLKGRRVGTPGYGMSANTWIRGFLKDEYGVEADDMQWIETTKSSDAGELSGSGWSAFEPGGESPYFLPEGFPLKPGPAGVDESELLLSGQCDALITAITPQAFIDGDSGIKRLFHDVKATEQAYFRKTGLFPIMHVVGVRTSAIEENPGLPMAVYEMYSSAKQIAYSDLETTTSLKVSLPWVTQEFEQTRELMGRDYWRYGIEANRKELERVMRYTHEQGLVKRREDFLNLFHRSTHNT